MSAGLAARLTPVCRSRTVADDNSRTISLGAPHSAASRTVVRQQAELPTATWVRFGGFRLQADFVASSCPGIDRARRT